MDGGGQRADEPGRVSREVLTEVLTMTPREQQLAEITRRHFLGQCSLGLGGMALGPLTGLQEGVRLAPVAKSVIYLHMAGSPPQQDLFDYKPKLNERDGEPCPEELFEAERFAFIKGVPKLLGTMYRFAPQGEPLGREHLAAPPEQARAHRTVSSAGDGVLGGSSRRRFAREARSGSADVAASTQDSSGDSAYAPQSANGPGRVLDATSQASLHHSFCYVRAVERNVCTRIHSFGTDHLDRYRVVEEERAQVLLSV